jgi:hypothetical protein
MDRLRFVFEYPYIYALLGGFLLFLALLETLIGEALTKGHIIYRFEDPQSFRLAIRWTIAIGVILIGYFAYLRAKA